MKKNSIPSQSPRLAREGPVSHHRNGLGRQVQPGGERMEPLPVEVQCSRGWRTYPGALPKEPERQRGREMHGGAC
jgi:hypothetical protein